MNTMLASCSNKQELYLGILLQQKGKNVLPTRYHEIKDKNHYGNLVNYYIIYNKTAQNIILFDYKDNVQTHFFASIFGNNFFFQIFFLNLRI